MIKHTHAVALLFAAVSVAFAPVPAASAEEGPRAEAGYLNELTGSTNAALTFGSGQNTRFNLGLGYSRTILNWLQGTTETTLSVMSGKTTWDFRIGPTLDYAIDDTGLSNAVYLAVLAGFGLDHKSVGDEGDTSTSFSYKVALGKRFELWKNITWQPEFNVTGTTAKDTFGATQKPTFALVPIQFSFSF
jgi:hypothetical protein